MNSVISLEGIEKMLGKKFVLGPLDLKIESGYIVAVVGPNGSGKSTLFRMLMGIIQPAAGELKIFGAQYPQAEVAIKQRIGYVPETSEWNDSLKTAQEAIRFTEQWYPTWDPARCSELLDKFEIDPKEKLSTMSKGTQRKVELILALANQPDLLLLDEPSSGLDPFAWRLMLEEITAFMQGGQRTVFMATHIMDEVRRLADYVVFLYHGKLLGYYEKDALLDNWKALWVDRVPDPEENIPGIVAIEKEQSVRIISESSKETLEALSLKGISVIKTQSLELDEIFLHLLKRNNDRVCSKNGDEE